jgi:MFS family permease
MFRFDKAFRHEFQSNWLPLVTAFSCLLFGLSVPAFATPFLFPEVIAEFGWSREVATFIASIKYISAALGALFFGLVMHRVGEWRALLILMTLAGAAMLSWIWISDLTVYYLSGVMSGVAVGGGAMAIKLLVARSFHSSQGTAMGMVLMGSALAGTLIPVVITFLISTLGWRYGYAAMSLSIWAVVIPLLIYGYFHSRRQLLSAQPASDVQDSTSAAPSTGDHEGVVASIRYYLRQKNFWMIASAISISSLVDAGFYQHQVLILKDFSFSPATVVTISSIIGLISVGARVLSGNILDSTSNRGLAGFYLTLLLTCAAAPFLPVPVILITFMLLRAFGHAVVLLDTAVMTKHAFGNTKDLGILFALMSVCTSLGSASGPWLMARIFDVTGSYNLAYVIFAGFSILAVILALNIKSTYWLALNLKVVEPQGLVNYSSIASIKRQN